MSRGFRVYVYAAALVGLLAFLAGCNLAIWQWVDVGVVSGSPAVGLFVAGVALAVWGLHGWLASRAARPLTMAAAAEQSAPARKAYLALGQLGALAAAVTQAFVAVRLVLLGLLGEAAPAIGARVTALGAGVVLALLVWGLLRWTAIRDGDFGRELNRAASWRRAYIYLAALAGSALAAAGGWLLLRAVIELAWRPLAAGDAWRGSLAAGLAALVVGGMLALFAWRRADQQAAAAPAAEVNALGRVSLRYGGVLLGAIGTIVSAAYLVGQGVLMFIGQEGRLLGDAGVGRLVSGPVLLALLPVALITWTTSAAAIGRDTARIAESGRTAAVRRLVRYAVAGLALAALWFGLTECARLMLQVVLDRQVAAATFAAGGWRRFAAAAALVVVAAPAWWGHWWSQQVRARAAFPAGYGERTSSIRRAYLGAVILLGAVVVVAALGFGAFLALNWRSANTASGLRAVVAGAGAAALVALFWTVAHALVQRGDARWLASDRAFAAVSGAQAANVAAQGLSEAASPVEEALSAPALPEPAPEAPKRYLREELAATAGQLGSAAPVDRAPLRPLAVIDGMDGVIGAALIAALREALPGVPLWPIGLNAAAQVAMLDALGGGTPPAVPPDALGRVAAILGPADILAPGGLGGEVPVELAAALASAPARLLLLPPRSPQLRWVAAPDWPLARWVENAVIEASALLS